MVTPSKPLESVAAIIAVAVLIVASGGLSTTDRPAKAPPLDLLVRSGTQFSFDGNGSTFVGVSAGIATPPRATGDATSPVDRSQQLPPASSELSTREARASAPTYNYFEKTFHLTGLNPLTTYLDNGNGLNTQLPTLSSDTGQPAGIYYIDNSSNLVEMSLRTSAVHTIAPVTLLYQKYGYNEMLDNEFFIEYASHMALLFGTRTTSTTNYSIELVNLRSGAVRMWNTSAARDPTNQEPIYLNNNTVIVLSSNGSILAYNLASHQRWKAGTLPFFESNNLYWLPQKQEMINVEADGSTGDRVQQLNASYDPHGHVHFMSATMITVDSGIRFNWVNGIGYNASADEIAFAAGYWVADTVGSYTIRYGSNGLITATGEQKWPVFVGSTATYPTIFNGQRYVYTSNYVMGAPLSGKQYLFDPWNGSTILTNRSFLVGASNPCANACFEDTFAPSIHYLIDAAASQALGVPFYRVVYAYHQFSRPYPAVTPPTSPRHPAAVGPTPGPATPIGARDTRRGFRRFPPLVRAPFFD